MDISMDPDSEIITAIGTPPANNDEARNAEKLIEMEERAHGNDVAALSIDGIGFRGDVLRALQDPNGLGLDVYVPPKPEEDRGGRFGPEAFRVLDDGQVCECPAGERTEKRYRNSKNTSWQFYFRRSQCKACPLLEQCMEKLPVNHGRVVNKNDYEAEYRAAREKAKSPAYALIRKEHPIVERKLAEIVRYHDGRRARYWGRWRVAIQYWLTAMVVKIKRIKLLTSDTRQLAPAMA